METEKIDFEKLNDLIKKYPMGSKILCTNIRGCREKTFVCKVVGYSTYTYRVLVYNPELDGHGSNRSCVDSKGELLKSEDFLCRYGLHCALVADRTTPEGAIVGGGDG